MEFSKLGYFLILNYHPVSHKSLLLLIQWTVLVNQSAWSLFFQLFPCRFNLKSWFYFYISCTKLTSTMHQDYIRDENFKIIFQIQEANIAKETKQFTYKDGDQYVFMDLVWFSWKSTFYDLLMLCHNVLNIVSLIFFKYISKLCLSFPNGWYFVIPNSWYIFITRDLQYAAHLNIQKC